MHIKKIKLILFILLIFYGCKSLDNKNESLLDNKFLKYENKLNKIIIYYPENWEKLDNKLGTLVAFRSPLENKEDNFQDNFNIVIEDIDINKMTLEKYNDFSILQLKKLFNNLEIIISEQVLINNNNAYKNLFKMQQGIYNLKTQQIYLLKRNKAYIFTFTSTESDYEKYILIIDKMINTMRIE